MFGRGLVKCLAVVVSLGSSLGMTDPIRSANIEVELLAETTAVVPGQPFWVGVRLAPDEHWKTYWRNPGGTGLPTGVSWRLPEGASAGEIHWPYPQRFEFQGVSSYGYEGEVLLLAKIDPGPPASSGRRFELGARVSWLVCEETCIPGSADLSLKLPWAASAPGPDARSADLFRTARSRLPAPTEGWWTVFAIQDGEFRIETHSPEALFADAEDVRFYPYEGDLISDGAPLEKRWTPSTLYLRHATSDYLAALPDAVGGVLVVTTADREMAYALNLVPGSEARPEPSVGSTETSPDTQPNLAYVMVLAIAGGLLLNLMPCVFPVLSLKAIGLMEAGNLSNRAHQMHGIAYTLGVMSFFCAVAGVLYLLKSGGTSVGWGFQLQTPWFVALLAYVLFLLGLNFSGLLTFGTRFMGVGESLVQRGGYLGSFFTGALAAVVASPCTAPFMGTAIAFAITQPPISSLLVFMSLAFGMALPFLLIAFIPHFARWLPRPGPWMHTFKQVMAFPLYLTAIWLLWVLGRQTDATGMALVLIGMLLLFFAVWLLQIKPPPQGRWRPVVLSLAITAKIGALVVLLLPEFSHTAQGERTVRAVEDGFWEPYSGERLAELRAQGRPVFVNITADWCISCIANERVALSMDAVRQAFKDKGVVSLKGDWTNRRPNITRVLESFGRNGVPLYVLYGSRPDAEPLVLPQWLTPMNVMESLESI